MRNQGPRRRPEHYASAGWGISSYFDQTLPDPPFEFGNPRVNAVPLAQCCGKPRGCTMTHDGCLYLGHPWKRAMVFGDRTVRCQADSPIVGQCVLLNGHDGPHQLPSSPSHETYANYTDEGYHGACHECSWTGPLHPLGAEGKAHAWADALLHAEPPLTPDGEA